jgi:hypothetical protein
MASSELLVVCGARRSGTTLLAAVLSANDATPPLPGEAQLVPRWLETYRWANQAFAIRALPYFADRSALRDFYREQLAAFVRHCRRHFAAASVLLLKSPEISLFFPEALELFPSARFVVTTRDPRDQVASEWRVLERRQLDWDREVLRDRAFERLAAFYVDYYQPILQGLHSDRERIYVQRFEDLVQDPERAIAGLGRFAGLDLRAFDPTQDWPRVAPSYWAYGTSPSDTPYYGRAIEAGRVATYREVMSEDEAARVIIACGEVAATLGYTAAPVGPVGGELTRRDNDRQ